MHPAIEVDFLSDLTYVDEQGTRHVEQEIFDEVFRMIENARRLVLIDMFLYNDFQGEPREETRPLSEELTQRLLAQKQRYPDISMVVITDPINTIYGGKRSSQFERLRAGGIQLVETDLSVLRDSNAFYSLFWRLLVKPFGNTADGRALPNPFGDGRVSIRSYLSLLNFKANHRKVIIADNGDKVFGLVTSANPHDGSSAHHNVAVRFSGPAVMDLLQSERSVMAFSSYAYPGSTIQFDNPKALIDSPLVDTHLQVITEGKIKDSVLEVLEGSHAGDDLDLIMFYLSDRDIVKALIGAWKRGVSIRVLLDPNKDAFGREKNGIPNRQVAHELHSEGIPVRWCDTHGEQCHSKMLVANRQDDSCIVVLGSANYTRRNLDDFNLETNVAVYGPHWSPFAADARAYFDLLWSNEPGRKFSVDYEAYKERSFWKTGLYRFMEATGISTF